MDPSPSENPTAWDDDIDTGALRENGIPVTAIAPSAAAPAKAPASAPAAAAAPQPPAAAAAAEEEETAAFRLSNPLYSMEDVVLNTDTRTRLNDLLTLIQRHDFLYTEWGLGDVDPQGNNISVNFYGPPGTGKTMCAYAIAHELGQKIIDVDYAQLESQYVGDTGKNIAAAFRYAREHNAVLFFDEADSILGKRMSNVTQATDHAVNTSRAVMLKELDHHKGIVIFATNLAENFDKAFMRRILSHIEVPLPDTDSRIRIWQKYLMPTIPGHDTVDVATLAEHSEGLSGGDIKNAFVKACSLAFLENETAPQLTTAAVLTTIEQVKQANRDIGGQRPYTESTRTISKSELDALLNTTPGTAAPQTAPQP